MPKDRYMGEVERFAVDSDERGFYLTLETERGIMRYRIQNVAPDFFHSVRRVMGPWIREMEDARLAFLCNPDESAGLAYETSDPKRDDFHSVHVDLWDAR